MEILTLSSYCVYVEIRGVQVFTVLSTFYKYEAKTLHIIIFDLFMLRISVLDLIVVVDNFYGISRGTPSFLREPHCEHP